MIHGNGSKCSKAEWYDNILPIEAIVTTRLLENHDVRRRVWDQGYSVKALQNHEGTILEQAMLLEDKIRRMNGQEVNIPKWFEYYGFDVIGLVQYSKSFGMLESGQSHWVLEIFKGGTMILGTMTPVPWLIHIVNSIPFIGDKFEKYSAWATQSIEYRIQVSEVCPQSESLLY